MSGKNLQPNVLLKSLFILSLVFSAILCAVVAVFFTQIKDTYHNFKAEQSIIRAKQLLKQGKTEGARIYLINAYRHRPDKQQILTLYKSILRENDTKNYISLLMQIYRDMPDNAENVIEFLNYLDGNSLTSITDFLIPSLLQHHSHNPEVLFKISTHYAKQKKMDQAVAFIREARRIDPSNPKYEAQELTYQLTNNDQQILISTINRLETIRKSQPEYFKPITISLAEVTGASDPLRAIALLDEILLQDPYDWFAKIRRALFAVQANISSPETITDILWNEASTLDQKLHIIAFAHANLPEGKADLLLQKLSAKERGEKRSQQLQLMIDWENKRIQNVLARAKEQLTLNYPQFDKLIFAAWLYRVHKSIKDKPSLQQTTDTIKKLAQTHPEEAIRAATVLSSWKDYDLMKILYETVAESSKSFRLIALMQLSNLHITEGKIDDFYSINKTILDENPAETRAAINYVRSAILTKNELPKAKLIAERLFIHEPQNPEYALVFAEALYATGQKDFAVKIVNNITHEEIRNQKYFQEFLKKLGTGINLTNNPSAQ